MWVASLLVNKSKYQEVWKYDKVAREENRNGKHLAPFPYLLSEIIT